MDENTSGGATRYEAAKGYFRAIDDAGGAPFGIPFLASLVGAVRAQFDGLVSTGGRFAYPPAWYLGEASAAPVSDRFDVERALVGSFQEAGKPMLGICAGMQMMACLNGCRLTADLRSTIAEAIEHDRRDYLHTVRLTESSRLREIVGQPRLETNSFHREAVVALSPQVVACAFAADGVVEAIELTGHPFALGVQWHQELFADTDHPGNEIFRRFVQAC